MTASPGSRPPPGPKRLEELKVLLVALRHEYGRPARGDSYEYQHFYLSFQRLCREVQLFDFHALAQRDGKAAMNAALTDLVETERPDLALFALYGDEFAPRTVEGLRRWTETLAYFFDDLWRVEFALAWAPRFGHVATPSTGALRRYHAHGYRRVLYSPLGYNHWVFQKHDTPKRYDVSFVGGSHPYRSWVIRQLRRAGIQVAVWGGGVWPAGRVGYDALVTIINESKVNLNISNSRRWDLPYLVSSPRALSVALTSRKTREPLKGRCFEVAGCGGFLLTHYMEDLERCFAIGGEVVVYADVDDLVDKIRHYVAHDGEREAIAAAAHRRALAEHTYARRLGELVERIFSGAEAAPA